MSDRRQQLEATLASLFGDAAGPSRVLSKSEAVAAGIPRRHVEGVVRNARAVQNQDQAAQAAAEWAQHIDAEQEKLDGLSTSELVDRIPRGF